MFLYLDEEATQYIGELISKDIEEIKNTGKIYENKDKLDLGRYLLNLTNYDIINRR